MAFKLHAQLQQDTILIADLALSKLLIMNDSRYPWFILVPRIENAVEWHNLSEQHQSQLFTETMQVAKIVSAMPNIKKINIGALGNVVSQLHVHIIGRNARDEAWPKPVWGIGNAVQYEAEAAATLIAKIKTVLGFHP
ncbi:MAG: diadenosine tetraphosphate (Ap4A) hydrolase-like protein [Hyphomonadaceae bacterium]|nr:MAG: diadenosine tetraphosphate (Ap4A) hydrolase-like protein [Hyphomonadaceae bacterium]KAF0184709.1 MAG: diadenosine tetraphosphate (Ap4A) hydrolase-like protein [Hyphomonadaceae bacterium]